MSLKFRNAIKGKGGGGGGVRVSYSLLEFLTSFYRFIPDPPPSNNFLSVPNSNYNLYVFKITIYSYNSSLPKRQVERSLVLTGQHAFVHNRTQRNSSLCLSKWSK